MHSSRKMFLLFVTVLIAGITTQVWARAESKTIMTRQDRMNQAFSKLGIATENLKRLVDRLQSTKTKFAEIVRLQDDLSRRLQERHTDPFAITDKYQNDMENARTAYSQTLKILLDFLEQILTKEQITLLYQYLYDELWYEGLITEATTLANPSIEFKTSLSIDSTVLQSYDLEELRKVTDEFLRTEGDEKESEITLNPPSEGAPLEMEETKDLEPEEIKQQQVSAKTVPPWQGITLPPATLESIRCLFEEQSLPVLKFYWLDLAPQAEEMMQKRLQQNLQ